MGLKLRGHNNNIALWFILVPILIAIPGFAIAQGIVYVIQNGSPVPTGGLATPFQTIETGLEKTQATGEETLG